MTLHTKNLEFDFPEPKGNFFESASTICKKTESKKLPNVFYAYGAHSKHGITALSSKIGKTKIRIANPAEAADSSLKGQGKI